MPVTDYLTLATYGLKAHRSCLLFLAGNLGTCFTGRPPGACETLKFSSLP